MKEKSFLKKILVIVVLVICAYIFIVKGNTEVKRIIPESQLHTKEEINQAMDAIENDFFNFEDSHIYEMEYLNEDYIVETEQSYAKEHNYDKVIMIKVKYKEELSNFEHQTFWTLGQNVNHDWEQIDVGNG